MALKHCSFPSPSAFPLLRTNYQHSPKLQLFRNGGPKSPIQFSLYATPPLSHNTSISHSPIFPSDLEQRQEADKQDPQFKQTQKQEQDLESTEEDPAVRFFTFHSSNQHPDETEFDFETGFKVKEEQLGSENSGSRSIIEGVVGEILEIARHLPGNSNLREVLGGFEGRVGKSECVEVLGLMGREGLLMGCLYFFEWMGLREPSLITPRACLVLFPILGRAGLGDALIVLVRNLPNTEPFKDVGVYNAALSGLLWCGSQVLQHLSRQEALLVVVVGWKEIEYGQSGGATKFRLVLGSTRLSLQDNNREKDHPELFYGRLSDARSSKSAVMVVVLVIRATVRKWLTKLVIELQSGGGARWSSATMVVGYFVSFQYDDAWKIFDTMETNNVQPDHMTCSIMITIMRKNGRSAKDAWEFFEQMNRKGVKWGLEVFCALIKSFCDEGLKKEALIIQIEMEKKGIASNASVYNTLMDAYNKSDQVEEAEGLFAEMKSKGIKPMSVTYNTLMDAYSRRMQPEIVEKLLVEMENIGLEPNVKSYTCLISAYGRQRKMSDMAVNAFLRMKKVGIKPTAHSYTALIHAYSVDGWHEKAFAAFENMQREGLKPSIQTYTALLDAFRRAGDTQMLMKIWKLMISEKIDGTRMTFNTLVDGFAKQGHYIEARDVICKFGKIGLQPTVMTYNMLMNAYARGGQHSKLPQLLKEMSALNLTPDSITYATMIYAYVRVRDFNRAFFYHKMMVKSGKVPDAKSYEKLRAILDVKAAKKSRKDREAILGMINSTMGLLKPKKKSKKDEFWKNKKQSRIHTSAQVGHK
ncbi:pentatricopeptide repeat (PPR) superfamily protein [Actinidia rufa]|uniref:Pentatricopeptide repeat (PPR) superfamily protein n=1 Tax=Actinidia rufa TaxID=165716 RepID=A0A7J0DPS3_9ERIC|nr:pentatricopeptide repeat (PPR) superfamily protein [Actinidia rufa]